MTIDVPIGLLAGEAAKYDFAYLLTVSKELTTRLVAVTFTVAPNGVVHLPQVGNSQLTNVAIRRQATVLFPPTARADHTLIVDGSATADLEDGSVTVTPSKCTLHRPAPAKSDKSPASPGVMAPAAALPGTPTRDAIPPSITPSDPAQQPPGPGQGISASTSPRPATPTNDAIPPSATPGAPAAGQPFSGAPGGGAPAGGGPVGGASVSGAPGGGAPVGGSPGGGAPASGAPQGGPAAGSAGAAGAGSVEDRLAALRNRAEREDLAHVEKSTLEHMADLTGKGLTSKYDLNQTQFTEVTSAPGSNTTAKPWDYPVRPGQAPAAGPPGQGQGQPAAPSVPPSNPAALGAGDPDDTIVDAEIVEDDPRQP